MWQEPYFTQPTVIKGTGGTEWPLKTSNNCIRVSIENLINYSCCEQKDFKFFKLRKKNGIDLWIWEGLDALKNTRVQKRVGRKLTSTNLYHKLLVKLFKFLARRTDSGFNKTVLRRLGQSGVNRYPVSLSRLVKYQQNVQDKTRPLVVVANVTNEYLYYISECSSLDCPQAHGGCPQSYWDSQKASVGCWRIGAHPWPIRTEEPHWIRCTPCQRPQIKRGIEAFR